MQVKKSKEMNTSSQVQYSNVKYYCVKVSMWRQGFGSLIQEFVKYNCFGDDASILLQIFCLINCFLCLLIFQHLIQTKRTSLSLRIVCTKLVFHCLCFGLGFPGFKFQYLTDCFVWFLYLLMLNDLLLFAYHFLNVFSIVPL